MEAAAIKNDKNLGLDGFEFSYFPIKWISANKGGSSLSEITLSTDQILELRILQTQIVSDTESTGRYALVGLFFREFELYSTLLHNKRFSSA